LWENFIIADKILCNNRSAKIILLSSISVYGQNLYLKTAKQVSVNPNIYGIAKSYQEKIYNSKYHDRLITLRLPAILAKGSVVHLPSRILNSMKQNQEVEVSNPDRLWNACLSINDLFNLIVYLINKNTSNILLVPHFEGSTTIIELYYTFKKLLNSNSKIVIVNNSLVGNVSFIDFDLDLNGFRCLNLYETIEEYVFNKY